MASTAIPTLSQGHRKRKPITYGKRSWSAAQDGFGSFERPSPETSPRRLLKPTQSPARKALRRDATDDSDPFDVPSSGEEAPSRKPSPAGLASYRRRDTSTEHFKDPASPSILGLETKNDLFSVPSSEDERILLTQPNKKPAEDPVKKRRRAQHHTDGYRNEDRAKGKGYTSWKHLKAGDAESDTSQEIHKQFQRDMGLLVPVMDSSSKSKQNGPPAPGKLPNNRVDTASQNSDAAKKSARRNVPQRSRAVPRSSNWDSKRSTSAHSSEEGNVPSSTPPRRVNSGHLNVPVTPDDRISRSSTPGSTKRMVNTPKQAKLWDNLLDKELDETSIQDLQSLEFTSTTTRGEGKGTAVPARTRRRIVDVLEAPADASMILEDEMSIPEDPEPRECQVSTNSLAESFQHHIPENAVSAPSSQMFENGPKITYAKQRSYVDEPSLGVDAILSQPLDDFMSPEASTAKQGGKRSAKLTAPSEDEEETKGIRNLHELRAAKATRRIAFELDAITIDLDSGSSISTKRAALLDLCKKLLHKPFRKEVVEHGYEFQIFKKCSDENDTITTSALAACVILLLEDNTEHRSALQLYEARVMQPLARALDVTGSMMSVAKERKTNMSKLAQKEVTEFALSMQNASIWKAEKPTAITPKTLSLRGLEMLTRRLREAGSQDALLDSKLLNKLLTLFRESQEGLVSTEHHTPSDPITLEMVLSILESATIAPLCTSNTTLWNKENLDLISGGLTGILDSKQATKASLRLLALRICLNLTNNNAQNSLFFAEAQFVKQLLHDINKGFESVQEAAAAVEEAEETSLAFDTLILSLGTMINLAEWSQSVRKTTSTTARTELQHLIKHFLRGRKLASEADSLEASRANIPFGYLAILLGNLCLSAEARDLIQSGLSKRSLAPLAEAVDEFILYNKLADENEAFAAFSIRLQAVSDSLKTFTTAG